MSTVQFDFSGKTVILTGASSGIGRAAVAAFAKTSARIAIGDWNV